MRRFSLITLALLSACSLDQASAPDVGLSEAGPNLDSGPIASRPDAAAVEDAGTTEDAGASQDAAVNEDAGGATLEDAGAAQDAGAEDDAGAGDDGGLAPDGGMAQDDAGQAGDAGPQGPTATLSGRIQDVLSRAAASGVRICVDGREANFPCATSDNSGNYSLQAPAGEAITITFTAGTPAIQSSLVHVSLNPGVSTWNLLSLSQSTVPLMFNLLGQQQDATKGHVSFTTAAAGQGLAGSTIAMVPHSGHGPVYLSAQGMPAPGEQATSSNGTGTIVNVNPGTVELRVTPPGTHDCAITDLGVTGAGGGWSTPVRAGFLSVAVFDCTAR